MVLLITDHHHSIKMFYHHNHHHRTMWTMFIIICIVSMYKTIAKEIDSKSDLLEEETLTIPAEHRAYPELDLLADELASSGQIGQYLANNNLNLNNQQKKNNLNNNNNNNNILLNNVQQHLNDNNRMPMDPGQNDIWPMVRPDTSSIKMINVKCEKNQMKVNIEFDRPFNGVIFSKGYYSDPKCVHLPAGSGRLQVNFEIFLGSCGMASSEKINNNNNNNNNPSSSLGLFIENTIIIQYDPQVQEIWDQARKLRCTWYDFYEKAVSFRPFNVDMLDAVTANFLGDNIQCWMQIQVGKGPWASEVAGIVKIGQTMTMVLAIKDEENKFDMLVRNCIAHDGKHAPIQLVDDYGCIVRPKIMSKFQKIKNFGHSATVVSYAYFQAFKFPDSMNVHFQCVIQVCRHECPPANCEGGNDGGPAIGPLALESMDTRKFLNRFGEIATTTVATTTTNGANVMQYSTSQNRTAASNHRLHPEAMPRALKLQRRRRRRRRSTIHEHLGSTDVNAEKVIKVVAPGDVAFTLPMAQMDPQKSSDYDSTTTTTIFMNKLSESNLICMPATGFIISLVLLIMLLLVTCIVTIFLAIRLKNVSKSATKNASMTKTGIIPAAKLLTSANLFPKHYCKAASSSSATTSTTFCNHHHHASMSSMSMS